MSDVMFLPVKSANISSVGYDVDAQELHVLFSDGTGYWIYPDVTFGSYQACLIADSIGSYINRRIRGRSTARREKCPECGDLGWLLNDHHAGEGSKDGPLSLDLVPCIYPTCGAGEPRMIATLGIRGQFADVVRHPKSGDVLALTGFREPEYR